MEQNQTIQELAAQSQEVTAKLMALANDSLSSGLVGTDGFFMIGLTIFVLAAFVGYYVIWNVTPALHSPLMSATNAISGVVIAGALVAAGVAEDGTAKWLGFIAVTLASINIFGGFAVTDRMLAMFKKK